MPPSHSNTFHSVHAPPHQQLNGLSPAAAAVNLQLVFETNNNATFMQFLSFSLHCPLLTLFPSADCSERPKGNSTSSDTPLSFHSSATKAPHHHWLLQQTPGSAGTSQLGYSVSWHYLLLSARRAGHFPPQDSRG